MSRAGTWPRLPARSKWQSADLGCRSILWFSFSHDEHINWHGFAPVVFIHHATPQQFDIADIAGTCDGRTFVVALPYPQRNAAQPVFKLKLVVHPCLQSIPKSSARKYHPHLLSNLFSCFIDGTLTVYARPSASTDSFTLWPSHLSVATWLAIMSSAVLFCTSLRRFLCT